MINAIQSYQNAPNFGMKFTCTRSPHATEMLAYVKKNPGTTLDTLEPAIDGLVLRTQELLSKVKPDDTEVALDITMIRNIATDFPTIDGNLTVRQRGKEATSPVLLLAKEKGWWNKRYAFDSNAVLKFLGLDK